MSACIQEATESGMFHLYRQLVLNAPDAILVVSNGTILFANPAAAQMVGLSDPSALTSRNVSEFVPPEAKREISELVRQLHGSERRASLVPFTMLRKDGEIVDIELMTCPTVWDGVAASIVFVRDVTARNRAERALKASEQLYRSIVDSMNEALVVLDADSKVAFVNQRYCTLFDCQPLNVIGKPASELYSRDTASIVESHLTRRRLGIADQYQATLTSKSGKSILAQISAAPMLREGAFAGSVALITDITDQARTSEKLHLSEQRFRQLVDGSPNYVFSFDQNNRYTAANKAVQQSLCLTEEQILGRTLEEVGFAPEVAREWDAQMDRTRATGQVQTIEVTVSLPGREPRVKRRMTSPMYSADGQLAGVSGMSVDVTEQKASEARTGRLLRAVEQMDEVMFTTDPSGVIVYVNPAFERVYGFTREEAIGQTPRIIKSFEVPTKAYEHFWAELTAGRTVHTEFVNRRKDGQLVRVVASVSPIHGEDGQLTGFTAVQRDITLERKAEEERRKLEEQLARTAKMESLGTLAGGIAHDFNNILGIILTHTTMMERKADDPSKVKQGVETIKSAVTRGAALSRQILTFARNTAVDVKPIQPDRIVHEVGSMIREMFPRNVRIDVVDEGGIPAILADANQLHQAVLNLCLNARDAMSHGGELRLSIQRVPRADSQKLSSNAVDADHVCIAVSDTGEGMSKETVSRIFEPFFTTKQVGKGTGLGLAVVYGVMRAHKGWVDVTSAIGAGTTMRLYFPTEIHAIENEAAARSPQRLAGGTESILMIEDEKAIAAGLKEQLAEIGHAVTIAHDAGEATACLRDATTPFDIVVTDLGLPGISSRELVKLLRQLAPDVPLIAMTGYVDPELQKAVVFAGAHSVLQKPFTIDQLVGRIRTALKK